MDIRYKNTSIKIIGNVYCPSEDSFLLADAVLSEIRGHEKILEVGCGSGFISAVVMNNTKADIVGIDISPHAVKCTKENGIEAIRGDLLAPIKGQFDIIVFNPPYLPTNEEERDDGWLNAALDGGIDGRKVIYRFVEDAGRCLSPGGKIFMLASSLAGIDEIKSKMASLGFRAEERRHERYMFELLTVICAAKN